MEHLKQSCHGAVNLVNSDQYLDMSSSLVPSIISLPVIPDVQPEAFICPLEDPPAAVTG